MTELEKSKAIIQYIADARKRWIKSSFWRLGRN